jgi:hypothetical protein
VQSTESNFLEFKELYLKGLLNSKLEFLQCRNKIIKSGVMKGINIKKCDEVITNQECAVVLDRLLQLLAV